MPELPEVETIVNQLKNKVLFRTITKLEIINSQVIDNRIKQALPAKIVNVYRRGKAIVICLDNGNYLYTHLRMTGHFYCVSNVNSLVHKKFLAGVFSLDDGSLLTHNSIRCFGGIKLMEEKELQRELCRLGVEPLAKGFTAEKFSTLMQQFPNAVIKNKLMDQSVIAGVGNIYAQEALYLAGIDPQKKIKDISVAELAKLCDELQRILRLAIKNKGTTVNNYSHITGRGSFQNMLVIYNKQKCPRGHGLRKINISGRGTSYCPKCQS